MTAHKGGSKAQQQSPRFSMERSGAVLSEQPVQSPAALGLSEAIQITEWVSLNSTPPCSCTDSSWPVSHLYAQCGRWEHFKPRQHIFWTFYSSVQGFFVPDCSSLASAILSNVTAGRFAGEFSSVCPYFFLISSPQKPKKMKC